MAEVSLEVNGRPFRVGCERGQEEHLSALAHRVDNEVRRLAAAVGPLGERQLLMMAALTLADELAEAGAERDRLQAEASGLRRERDALEARVVAALDAAARRIAALADPAGPQGTRLL